MGTSHRPTAIRRDFFMAWKMRLETQRKRHPFNDAVQRPPGESCRLKIEELYDRAMTEMFHFVAPIAVAFTVLYVLKGIGACIGLFIISSLYTLWISKRIYNIAIELRNLRLGFDGERLVGQEISKALAFGCKVYHDVRFDGAYNMDHIIVSRSTGVFVIETKARRKGHGDDSHIVRYDGQRLNFPEGPDVKYLLQAQDYAKDLYSHILKATGVRTWIEPIVALPGWFVQITSAEKAGITVLNPKNILAFVEKTSRPHPLSEKDFMLITAWLDQKNILE